MGGGGGGVVEIMGGCVEYVRGGDGGWDISVWGWGGGFGCVWGCVGIVVVVEEVEWVGFFFIWGCYIYFVRGVGEGRCWDSGLGDGGLDMC